MSNSGNNEVFKQINDKTEDGVIDKLKEIKQKSGGLEKSSQQPSDEFIDYPDNYNEIDRVLHVLWTQRLAERQIGWIATAAATDESACKVILGVLAANGIVITPTEYGANGYRLSPYYRKCITIQDEMRTMELLPSSK